MKTLLVHAKYEMKILMRSWFFKLFAIVSVLGIIGMDILFFSTVSPLPHMFSAMDSYIPYMNIIFTQYVLVVVLIFLTTDLYKRDTKFNTSFVVYIHSMTNFSLVFGRALGVGLLFSMLNVIYMVSGLAINLLLSDHGVSFWQYLTYPILISIPVMTFTIGFTLFLMFLLRNQAVVIILVLGILATSIIYLSEFFFLLPDIMGVKLGMAYSELIGFGQLEQIIYQRSGWFFVGLFFILSSVIFIKRLPQSKTARFSVLSGMVFLPVVIFYLFFNYYSYYQKGVEMRKDARILYSTFQQQNGLKINNYNLNLKHNGAHIEVDAEIECVNTASTALDTVRLLLNPSLTVQKVVKAGSETGFEQNGLELIIPQSIASGETALFSITYQGHVDERIMDAFLAEEDRVYFNHVFIFSYAVKQAITQKDYLLFTPDSYWYPQTITPKMLDLNRPFAHYTLTVNTKPELTAISQGEMVTDSTGTYSFKTTQPLKGLSLIVGNYHSKAVKEQQLQLALFTSPKHNVYQQHFTQIDDTVAAIFMGNLNEFEAKIEMEYPYKRFSAVEVPLQFHSYNRNGRENANNVQEEQVWITENLATNYYADLKNLKRRSKRRANRTNRTYSEQENEIRLAQTLFNRTLFGDMFGRTRDFPLSAKTDFTIYPLFLHLPFNIKAENNNGFEMALQADLKHKAKPYINHRYWSKGVLTDDEIANIALNDTTMRFIMENAEDEIKDKVLSSKGSFFLKMMALKLGEENYRAFFDIAINKKLFTENRIGDISAPLEKAYRFNLVNSIQNWMDTDTLAGFKIAAVDAYQIRGEDRIDYQVLLTVNNPTAVDGLIEIDFRFPNQGRRGFGRRNTATTYYRYLIPAGGTKKIGILLAEAPRMMRLNTLVSQNIPTIINIPFEKVELRENKLPFSGEKMAEWKDLSKNERAIIADNSTNNFELINAKHRSRLKTWIHENTTSDRPEYESFSWWRAPTNWTKIKFPSLYGDMVRSASYARGGSGERKAIWVVDIPQAGVYDIAVHVPDLDDFQSRRFKDVSTFTEQNYTIVHADGQDEATLDFSQSRQGWNVIGSYYFEKGPAEVRLNDDSSSEMVLADAVKWEPAND